MRSNLPLSLDSLEKEILKFIMTVSYPLSLDSSDIRVIETAHIGHESRTGTKLYEI